MQGWSLQTVITVMLIVSLQFVPISAIGSGLRRSAAEPAAPQAHPTLCNSEGWFPFVGSCYRAFSVPLSHANAELVCVAQGGHLATVSSFGKHNQVTLLMHSPPQQAIGETKQKHNVIVASLSYTAHVTSIFITGVQRD